MDDIDELMDVAQAAAEAAGTLLRTYADRRRLPCQGQRSARDLVTDADVAAEAAVVAVLAQRCPDDGILGEEQATRPGSSGRRWLVDPLDGTTNFVYGRPDWCVSVACEDVREPPGGPGRGHPRPDQAGAVPGRARAGAWRNGTRLGPIGAVPLGQALVNTGFHADLELRARQAAILPGLLSRVRDLYRNGSAALDLAGVASGQADAFFEAGVNPWDWSADGLLVLETGGRATLTGLDPRGLLVAAAPALHDELLAVLTDLVG